MFGGRVPAEVHQHYDADGNPCRAADAVMTVVEREPEWTDEDRELAMKLDEYEAGLCPCGCGQPVDEAADTKRSFSVDKFTCLARRAIESVKRADFEKAKAGKEEPPVGWDDGLTYYIDDSFVREPKEGPRG